MTVAVAANRSAARATVARSPLARAGGFAIVQMVDDASLRRLRQEAWEAQASATEVREEHTGDGETRGHADRWLTFAVGGPVLDALLCAPFVSQLLAEAVGVAVQPHGRLGTYSYYRSPGHHLGLHRDATGCDLAAITCLWATDGPGGELVVYPGEAGRRLAEVRADPGRGAHRVPLGPGDTVLLLGGIVPHLVTPVGPGQSRAVAPLCYRFADNAADGRASLPAVGSPR